MGDEWTCPQCSRRTLSSHSLVSELTGRDMSRCLSHSRDIDRSQGGNWGKKCEEREKEADTRGSKRHRCGTRIVSVPPVRRNR